MTHWKKHAGAFCCLAILTWMIKECFILKIVSCFYPQRSKEKGRTNGCGAPWICSSLGEKEMDANEGRWCGSPVNKNRRKRNVSFQRETNRANS
mmetsp:Transcript_9789/g.22556  ORF Transcript_9789/g.22556 Transcript_9789/m.22556 type:complete len:94 (-) Transcript_9789:450-731(-)